MSGPFPSGSWAAGPDRAQLARRVAPFVALFVTGVLVAVIPARTPAGSAPVAAASSSASTAAGSVAIETASDGAADATRADDFTVAPAASETVTPISSSSSSFSSTSPPPSTTSDTREGDEDSTAASSATTTTTIAGSPTPLRIVSSTWASAQAGTPAADAGVPAGSLPVGQANGSPDKASFVRLRGTASVFVLALVGDAGGNRLDALGSIGACRIKSSSWAPGYAVAFNAAPEYDPNDCVTGARRGDGAWEFDLSKYPTSARTDNRGFALVPGTDATSPNWQVAFDPSS